MVQQTHEDQGQELWRFLLKILYFKFRFFLIFLIIYFPSIPFSAESILRYDQRIHPEIGQEFMVVSQNEDATKVGYQILDQGGNAVDAAVAMGFALSVTLPRAGNLGGGGFMLIYEAESKQICAID